MACCTHRQWRKCTPQPRTAFKQLPNLSFNHYRASPTKTNMQRIESLDDEDSVSTLKGVFKEATVLVGRLHLYTHQAVHFPLTPTSSSGIRWQWCIAKGGVAHLSWLFRTRFNARVVPSLDVDDRSNVLHFVAKKRQWARIVGIIFFLE